jgi:hypothetical protein
MEDHQFAANAHLVTLAKIRKLLLNHALLVNFHLKVKLSALKLLLVLTSVTLM